MVHGHSVKLLLLDALDGERGGTRLIDERALLFDAVTVHFRLGQPELLLDRVLHLGVEVDARALVAFTDVDRLVQLAPKWTYALSGNEDAILDARSIMLSTLLNPMYLLHCQL